MFRGRAVDVMKRRVMLRCGRLMHRVRVHDALMHCALVHGGMMRRLMMLGRRLLVSVRLVRCLIVRSVQGTEMLRVPFVRSPKTFCKTIFHANSLS
jgi:hypothetical protein